MRRSDYALGTLICGDGNRTQIKLLFGDAVSKYSYKRKRTPDECGVWIPESESFCGQPVHLYRRCEKHFAALTRDDLYETIRKMTPEQRKTALDMLDGVQKKRPAWEYKPAEELPEV